MESTKKTYYSSTYYKHSAILDGDEYPDNHPFLTISKMEFNPRYDCAVATESLEVNGELAKIITTEEVEAIGIYAVKQKYGIL